VAAHPQWTLEAALDRAAAILAARSHSRAELAAKLRRAGIPDDRLPGVLDACERRGWLDDGETARQLAAELARKGYGPLQIRTRLRRKGLGGAEAAAAEAVVADPAEVLERARRAARRKRGSLIREPDPVKRRQKLARFLLQRGFPRDVVATVAREGEEPP
jgi:regulatory protein